MKKQEGFDDFLSSLGRTVKRHREEAGLTQEQLAIAIGSGSKNDARSYISKLEKGHRNPPASVLKCIAEVLGVSVCDLLNEAQDGQKKVQACELFEQCYGKSAFSAVQLFLKLDKDDQDEIVAMMEIKFQKDKYSMKKESSDDAAM